jgi:hypothetical protein
MRNIISLFFIVAICFFVPTNLCSQTGPEEKSAKFFIALSSIGYEKAIEEFLADDFLMYKDQIPELKANVKRIFE